MDTRLIAGDSIKVMKDLKEGEGRIRTTVTSPPYNIGVDYDNHDDCISKERYRQFTIEWSYLAREMASDDGWLFVNYGERLGDMFFSHEMAKIIESSGWHLRNRIFWLKRNPIYHNSPGNLTNVGEFVFMFSKDPKAQLEDRYAVGVRHIDEWFDRRSAKRVKRNGCYVRDRGNFWVFDEGDPSAHYLTTNIFESNIVMKNQNTNKSWESHPARFPLVLPAALIAISTKPGEWVMDPFVGSGTVSMAAKLLGRKSLGIDKSEKYINSALDRINNSEETLPEFYPTKPSDDRRSLF